MNLFIDNLNNSLEIHKQSKQSLQKYHKVIAHLSSSHSHPNPRISHRPGTPQLISGKVKIHL